MRNERSGEDHQHPGLDRSERRERQRQKARQGMRVSPRPDALRPVTVQRMEKLTRKR